jgi:acetyl esterase
MVAAALQSGMPLLPALQSFTSSLGTTPDTEALTPAQARSRMHEMIEAGYVSLGDELAPAAFEADHEVAVPGARIRVRVYRPDAGGALPGHLYFHGGGFWLGTLDHADPICRGISADADCVVISVDYRLAPEHPFPAAAEDSYAALCWVAEHAVDLGVDPSRISVGGGSAGGNLAAVVSLMARDRGGPIPVLQVLEIPVTDFTRNEPLVVEDEGVVIPSGKRQYGGFYLADPQDTTNPYASPLLAPDLHGLPPALVMVAEYDPLRPEGLAYAERLTEAGIAVEVRCWEGQFHGSQHMAKLIPEEAAAYRAQLAAALRRAYGTE